MLSAQVLRLNEEGAAGGVPTSPDRPVIESFEDREPSSATDFSKIIRDSCKRRKKYETHSNNARNPSSSAASNAPTHNSRISFQLCRSKGIEADNKSTF
jgi:hypothetical protein